MNKIKKSWILLWVLSCALGFNVSFAQAIPLPEHPRPDFQRSQWMNLNGTWSFEFDSLDVGLSKQWYQAGNAFSKRIKVPFPWGSELSGVKDEADIAWYQRSLKVPSGWKGKKVYINIGASDWETTLWIDGHAIGSHKGGYMPFSFDLTDWVRFDQEQTLTIRVDDKRRAFTLYGKQGYGNARGIWQTTYLEARGNTFIERLQCTPDIDKSVVNIQIRLNDLAQKDQNLSLLLHRPEGDTLIKAKLNKGARESAVTVFIPKARLWNLEDPYLYFINAMAGDDTVTTYFGMRKISVVNLPGTTIPYVALNNKPVYLQLTLDQSYHPQGFYTFPNDEFMRQEIERSKSIGLNGIRTHIKADIPRKLYWADRLGLFVMSDLPNSWGDPDEQMQQEAETTMKEMIIRDYNHPSIFSWIVFNETWGLISHWKENDKSMSAYLPSTQNWVASMYYMVKSMDQTRLVDDNSICCGRGHTETDLYSWHEYLPGWAWTDYLTNLTAKNYPGSPYHFETPFVQGNQPNINAECGNVWGYDGSTGDVDWSFDYHRMMNSFRMFPKMAGWLYTEHHDVINEWNGYWRFDRTNKYTGLEEIVPGMSLKDLHSDVYLSTGNEIVRNVTGGEAIEVPLYLSNYTSNPFSQNKLVLSYTLELTDATGMTSTITTEQVTVTTQPWDQKELPPLKLNIPDIRGLALLKLYLKTIEGDTLHRNFVHFDIASDHHRPGVRIISVPPSLFNRQQWDIKQWSVMDGLKVNGAGKGYFEYHIPVDKSINLQKVKSSYVVMEVSAKQLFDKDRSGSFNKNQDYMLGSKVSPSSNPNSYLMTDELKYPGQISISIDGKKVMTSLLPDDPADHRGVLSWNSQLKDKKLREAGSYGYLVKVPVTKAMLNTARSKGFLNIKIQSLNGGGTAIYGAHFGRYPVDVNLVME
jgi:hypothetical protein